MKWDKSVDLLIAGSGGGGMVAALAAVDAGIEPLVVEKQDLIGGSTGMSGGMVWLPNNPLMRAEGIPDSHEDGLAYFDDVIGDIGAASSPARREMFLTAGYEMIDFLLRKGVRLVRCPGWSDYYPNHKGGNAAGRSIEGIPYDAAALGDWSDKVQPSMAKNERGFVVKTNELRSVQYFNRSPQAFAVAMRVFLRTNVAKLRRRDLMTNGASFIGQILKVLIDLSGRAAGLDERRDGRSHRRGRPRRRRARHSRRHLDQHPGAQGRSARGGRLQPQCGYAPPLQRRPAQRGDVVDRQRRRHRRSAADGDGLGAQDRPARRGLVAANGFHRRTPAPRRSGPGGSDPAPSTSTATGKRFCNESNSYVEVGKAMYATKAVPCWQIFDEGYVGRYVSGANPLKKRTLSEELIEQGAVKRADTIADLARQIDVPARRAGANGQALQRVRGQGPRPRLRARPVGVQRSASAIPDTSPTPRSARSIGRRTTPPGCCLPTSAHAGE